MASGNLTITAPTGPGNTVTSLALSGCKEVSFEMDREVIKVTDSGGVIRYFDYETTATVTYTISGEIATITIST